ncbi:MAG: membrane-bound lytic murein transglycosylase MltF [Gammaproteobacteria bacterium]|nr:membrane-bound lytic murein transglycosylase MltF [Gammaproteobacteria bacterium]
MLMLMLISACKPLPGLEQTQLEQVLERGELRIGTIYGGTTYYVGSDGPQGFDYELAAAFASYLGVVLKVEAVYTTAELLALIDGGKVDLLAAGVTITDARLAKYRFSPSYKRVDQLLVYRNGERRPRNLGELNGPLKVVAGANHITTLNTHKASYPELSWQESNDQQFEELLDQVVSGDIAYSVVDSARLANYRRYQPELAVAFQLSTQEPLGWILANANDDSLYATLIEFFGQSRSDGLLTTLDEKYFGHLDQFNYVDIKGFIGAVENRLPRYRPLFEKYAGSFDWRLLAAISYKESSWRAEARSPTGVEGLMMLTQNTARHLGVTNRTDPAQSISGGSRYLAEMVSKVPDKVPEHERVWFALASYNIGIGHLLDAMRITQKRSANPYSWRDVKESLPLLRNQRWYSQARLGYARGDHAVAYVDAIRRYYDLLVYLDDRAARAAALAAGQSSAGPEPVPPEGLDEATAANDDDSSETDGP